MNILIASALLGLITTLVGTPYASRYLKYSGIVGIDQQKEDRPKLPTSGGIAVLFGFLVSISFYLGYSSLFGSTTLQIELILAALSSVIIITLIGLLDDVNIGKDGDQIREGIDQLPKMFFVLPAALPLIAVGAGSWNMIFPVIGTVEWGLIYPLVLLPFGLLFVSNVINMLAGTNGLSAVLSLITSASLGYFGYINGYYEAALIAFSLSAALLGFLKFNWYPATVLPGDSLTYLCGGAIFSSIVLGNMEKFAVFIFLLWFIEFFLKARSRFQAHSWGLLQRDGTLQPQHKKTYSLTHPLMRRGLNEQQITLTLAAVQLAICIAGIIIFS